MPRVFALLVAMCPLADAAVPKLPATPISASTRAPLPLPSMPALPSRDIARDEALAKLAAAGLPERLQADGLVLWHALSYRTRGGEKAALTVSLPPDGRPFERGSGDAERRAELDRRLAAVEGRVITEAARVLGLPEDMVSVNARLIETCCGAGCQSCLLTKPDHAERWTGLSPRPTK